ncbi:MAG: DUF2948 family protein [Beijerinckiaceae bacterium]
MSLKLIAFDTDDLAVISAHLQEADLTAAQIAWLPREKRLALVCARTDHAGDRSSRPCGVHFDRVTRVERLKMPAPDGLQALRLLGVTFAAGEAPAGHIVLLFDGGGALRLTVECIEAALTDLATPQEPA